MKLMIIGDWSRTTLQEVGSKFASGVDVEVPEGVSLIARWHDPSSRLVWVVLDTPDAARIQNWLVRWSEYMDWETYTVIDDEEVGELLDEVLQ